MGPPGQAYDLLVIGEINPDLIVRDDDVEPVFGQTEKLVEEATLTIGSSSAITACGAARLGLKTALIGLVGADLFGRFMLEALAERGVDISHVLVDDGQRTGLGVILSRGGDRAILTFAGAIGALRAEQVPAALLRRARHVHVGSYFLQTSLQPGLPALFRRVRALGATTSLDTNGDPSGRWEGLGRLLETTSLFLPNEAEAQALTGAGSAGEALAALARRVPQVALKRGAAGALAARGEGRAGAEALPVSVADTVGAGDSFNAGFIYGHLHGWPLARSLRLATVCGSLSTRTAGGTDGQPTRAEALAYLDPADDSAVDLP